MFNKTLLGLPMWVWLVVLGMIAYNCYITTSNTPAPVVANNMMGVAIKAQEDFGDDMMTLYNFNTAWCGYSKQLQPEWDKFAKNNKLSNVKVIDVKCDNKDDPNFLKCKEAKYMVEGFPTVVAEMGGKVVQYSGPRTEEALHKWAGVGAGLKESAQKAVQQVAQQVAQQVPQVKALAQQVAQQVPQQAAQVKAAVQGAVQGAIPTMHAAAPEHHNAPHPTLHSNQHIHLSHNHENVMAFDEDRMMAPVYSGNHCGGN